MEANTITFETLVGLLVKESLKDKLVLDLGCGSGQLTVSMSPHAKKVVGIDISRQEVENARRIARAKGIKNVEFYIADAEAIEYREFLGERVDVIGSNLCMSSEIIKRSSRALDAGSPFVFVCFHIDQMKEIGGSRFSFGEEEMNRLLMASGFTVEYLDVERWSMDLPEKNAELEIGNEPWARRRWNEISSYVSKGGRKLTQSRLIVKARKM